MQQPQQTPPPPPPADMKFCLNCKRWVKPTKPFSPAKFLLFEGLYVLARALKEPVCPICGKSNFGYPPTKGA